MLDLTGRERPRICFVGTASGEDAHDRAGFYATFSQRAEATHLDLFGRGSSDIAGLPARPGRDLRRRWQHGEHARDLARPRRRQGAAIRAAWEAGVVLAGWSAGGICWFEGGLTDSFGPGLAPLRDGLKFLQGSFCPHYDSESSRRPRYEEIVGGGELPDGMPPTTASACLFAGRDLAEVVASLPGQHAYRVERRRGNAVEETQIRARLLRWSDGRPASRADARRVPGGSCRRSMSSRPAGDQRRRMRSVDAAARERARQAAGDDGRERRRAHRRAGHDLQGTIVQWSGSDISEERLGRWKAPRQSDADCSTTSASRPRPALLDAATALLPRIEQLRPRSLLHARGAGPTPSSASGIGARSGTPSIGTLPKCGSTKVSTRRPSQLRSVEPPGPGVASEHGDAARGRSPGQAPGAPARSGAARRRSHATQPCEHVQRSEIAPASGNCPERADVEERDDALRVTARPTVRLRRIRQELPPRWFVAGARGRAGPAARSAGTQHRPRLYASARRRPRPRAGRDDARTDPPLGADPGAVAARPRTPIGTDGTGPLLALPAPAQRTATVSCQPGRDEAGREVGERREHEQAVAHRRMRNLEEARGSAGIERGGSRDRRGRALDREAARPKRSRSRSSSRGPQRSRLRRPNSRSRALSATSRARRAGRRIGAGRDVEGDDGVEEVGLVGHARPACVTVQARHATEASAGQGGEGMDGIGQRSPRVADVRPEPDVRPNSRPAATSIGRAPLPGYSRRVQPVAVRILHPEPGAGCRRADAPRSPPRVPNRGRRARARGSRRAPTTSGSIGGRRSAVRSASGCASLPSEVAGRAPGSSCSAPGSIPLATRRRPARARGDAAPASGARSTNNRYSSDVVAVGDAAILAAVPDLPSDNALPRWLEAAGVAASTSCRTRPASALDIDSPLDLELLRRHPACPPAARGARAVHVAPPRAGRRGVRRARRDRRAIRGSELLVSGRLSARDPPGARASGRPAVSERWSRSAGCARPRSTSAAAGGPSALGLLLDRRRRRTRSACSSTRLARRRDHRHARPPGAPPRRRRGALAERRRTASPRTCCSRIGSATRGSSS